MTRQYIGARYVPIFFDGAQGTEWLPNTQYEPLTIVTRNGNSYTSKKAVPAAIGAPENNAAYWASTGIYNAQVEEIRDELSNLGETVDGLSDEIDSINAVNFNPRITGRKIIIITDSYGVSQAGEDPYTVTFKNVLGLVEGENVFTHARGGAGFYNGEFYNLLNNSNDPSDVTDILVAGGCNDFGRTYEELIGPFTTFKTKAAEKYPNALIHIASIGHTKQQGYRDANTIQVQNYQAFPGARVLTGTENILHKYDLFVDDVHPNANGAVDIGRGLAAAFVNGSFTQCRYETISLTALEGMSIGSTSAFMTQHGGTISVSMMNRAAAFGGGLTLRVAGGVQYNTDYAVASISNNTLIWGNSESQIMIPFAGLSYFSGNNHVATGLFKIYNGQLYVAIMSEDSGMATLPETISITPTAIRGDFPALMC